MYVVTWQLAGWGFCRWPLRWDRSGIFLRIRWRLWSPGWGVHQKVTPSLLPCCACSLQESPHVSCTQEGVCSPSSWPQNCEFSEATSLGKRVEGT